MCFISPKNGHTDSIKSVIFMFIFHAKHNILGVRPVFSRWPSKEQLNQFCASMKFFSKKWCSIDHTHNQAIGFVFSFLLLVFFIFSFSILDSLDFSCVDGPSIENVHINWRFTTFLWRNYEIVNANCSRFSRIRDFECFTFNIPLVFMEGCVINH